MGLKRAIVSVTEASLWGRSCKLGARKSMYSFGAGESIYDTQMAICDLGKASCAMGK